ncbi:MAG: DUF3078 domain-containing protein [Rikenellaceae bacterium]
MKQIFLLFTLLAMPLSILAQSAEEKAAIRKERNSLEISTGIEGTLNNLNNAWISTSGGDNTISAAATLFLKHKFTKDKLTIESKLTAGYGYYNVRVDRVSADGTTYDEAVWYKNQDEFEINIAPSYTMSKNWSYSANIGFRSQFANGYVSSSSQESIHLKSGFLAPAYLDVAVGLSYQAPSEKFPIKISLSPLAASGVIVANDEIQTNAGYGYSQHTSDNWAYAEAYGVNPNKRSQFDGGSAIQFDFDRTFGKNATFRYLTSIYSFYGWITNVAYDNMYTDYAEYQEAATEYANNGSTGAAPKYAVTPTVRWSNKVEIKATKYLYTNLNFELYYDRSQNFSIQTKTILSLGVSYKFKNK